MIKGTKKKKKKSQPQVLGLRADDATFGPPLALLLSHSIFFLAGADRQL